MYALGFDSLQRIADKVNANPIEGRPVAQTRNDDSWPRFHPAIVTTAITSATLAEGEITCGTGVVQILRALQQSSPTDLLLEKIPSNAYPDLVTVFRPDISGISIPIGTRGYVTEDGWGTLYWMMGGAPGIVGVATSTIPEATYGTYEITPGFGFVDVYNWNAARTKLVKADNVRVANMAAGSGNSIAIGTKIMCKLIGEVYIVDWELCSNGV